MTKEEAEGDVECCDIKPFGEEAEAFAASQTRRVQWSTRLQSTSEHADKVLAGKTATVYSSAISPSSISHMRTQRRAADNLEPPAAQQQQHRSDVGTY